MVTLTKLPISFFERNLSDREMYIDIHRYVANKMGQEGFYVQDKWVKAKSTEGTKTFSVPTSVFAADDCDDIRGIDVIIFTFLCYVAHQSEKSTVKLNIGEIAAKTTIRKTQIKRSINHLVREEFLIPSKKSGFYIISELDNPEELVETENMLKSLTSEPFKF